MGIGSFVQEMERRFAGQIAGRRVMQPAVGQFEDFPERLHPKLQGALRQAGIERLYSHQVEAFEAIGRGEDTVLVSRTASGKTLAFLLPILDDYIQASAPFGVLLLYPTKALSRDQEGTLGKLLEASGADVRLATSPAG